MKSILFIGIALLMITKVFSRQPTAMPMVSLAKLKSSEQKINQLVKQYHDLGIFSGVVLVAKNGVPVYHKAFGLANRSKNIPNTVNTRFDIGSMNKSFTKVVVLNLVKDGKLHPEDKLGRFLDGFSKTAAEKVTVEQLINHRSGFGSYHDEVYWQLPKEQKNMDNLIKLVRKTSLQFEPGTEQQYSNTGYVILGAIIEKVTGRSYFDVVDSMVIKRLGLSNTFLRDKYAVPGRAIGYIITMRGVVEDNEFLQEQPTPAGGFYSTTTDMLTFYQAYHYGNRLWDEATKKRDAFSPFYDANRSSGGAIAHAGGFEGANTVHFEILRDTVSVMVFANMDEPVAERLGEGILAILRDRKPAKPILPAIQNVYKNYTEKGIAYIKDNFETLTQNFHPQDPKDLILNNIGYNLLYSGKEPEKTSALEIFKLNTELFPLVANVWDSYGEALLQVNDKKGALVAYKKALAIRPDLPSAKKAVELLENQ